MRGEAAVQRDKQGCLENLDKKVTASSDTPQPPAGDNMYDTALLTLQVMLASKVKKVQWACMASKVMMEKKVNLAKMELLVRKVNQAKTAWLDLQ